MKILVTNNTLNTIGGSETYAYTLIKELHSRPDIDVVGYSPNIGLVGNKLISEGIKITNRLENNYDLILCSHTSTAKDIVKLSGFKIQTCHGIYPLLEQPFKGMNAYVAISEEVRSHLKNNGFESEIIFNGINCDRFKSTTEINENVKNVLSLSQSKVLNDSLKGIFKKLNIGFTTLNKFINPVFNVEDLINKSDLVISLGRGVYEAMACGRNVMILDKRPYVNGPALGDGMLDDSNFYEYIKNNCSGRFSKKVFTADNLVSELSKYDKDKGPKLLELANKELNIKTQVNKYLKIYNDAKK